MIRIVHGVYGYLDKDGIVRPKTEKDDPFELTPEMESRLVRLGVAEYVRNVKPAPEAQNEEPVNSAPAEDEPQEESPTDGISLADLSAKELREIGKEYGLSFKVGMTKDDMVKAIEAAEAELDADDADGEPAPVFDATEAVQ